ncbi:unnamed protein product [Heterobilharzia americana]|nr:unnamed protein product [Heterobilharzia americana]
MLETNINVLFNSIQNSIVIDKNWLKLELLCWLLMSYISSICVKTDNTPSLEFDWDLLCSIFRRARDIFSEHILPVNIYLSAYPMICFYMCSLRGGLVISFVDFLWNAVKDEHRDQGSRLMALSYLCFLLVNGKFCFIDLVLEIMHDMATWCIDYTYRHRRLLTGAHTNLLSSDNKIYYEHFESCNRLPIAQISISPFKPMLNMSEELRRAFFQIISAYHLSWSTIGLTQSLCDRNNHQMKNDSLLTVEVIRSLKPSKVFHMPENKCALSLSSAVINGLFRNINLGECMISSQQDISVSKDNHYNSHNIVSSISPRRKKRKASTIGETEGITSELQSSKSYEESV